MARISFSPLIEEIVGKLAGSVFQDSYGGMQIRTRVSPRNPQTKYQQLRRGQFGYLSSGWRFLTAPQRQTFIDAAITPPAALNLYLQSNINLTLIEEPTITDYIPSSDPGAMPIEFTQAEPGNLFIKATTGPTTVPAGTKLLVQITYQRPPTRIFTNPSQYSPVISFDEGTDLSSPVNVITEWTARYGVFLPDKRLCLKSALIDKSNGLRGEESINCIISEEMAKFKRIYNNITPASSSGTSVTNIFSTSIPANTLQQDGDVIYAVIWGFGTAVAGFATITFRFNNANTGAMGDTSSASFFYIARIIRISATDVKIVIEGGKLGGTYTVVRSSAGSLDFTAAIPIEWSLQVLTSGSLTAEATYINQEQQ